MTLLRPAPPAAPAPSARSALSAPDRAAAHTRRAGLILAGLLPLLAFAAFFFYPVLTLIGRGFWGASGVDLSGFT
ncbi:MAG: iron ABC transporter permease, partial [Nakamurella sp.]